MKPIILAAVARMKIPSSMLKLPRGTKRANVHMFKEDMQRLGEEIAEGFKEKVVENIEDNTYGFSNAIAYAKRKRSDVPLIETHEMVDSIIREETIVTVEDTSRADSGLTNKELAMVLEYGTKDKGIPPRPVWRNTFANYKEEAKGRIDKFLTSQKFK